MAAKIPQADEADAEWALLARAAGGDERAFAAIVEAHEGKLVGLCTRWLGDTDSGRDAAQEVFLKAFRHAGRATPRGRLSTWLYRIAVNHCLNQLRRRRIARFFSLEGPRAGENADGGGDGLGPFDPADPAPDPERTVLARERWRRTRESLDRLPENQRVVLMLARFEGLSGREIAATLGISEGAVESRLVRAMRRLAPQESEPSGVSPARKGE